MNATEDTARSMAAAAPEPPAPGAAPPPAQESVGAPYAGPPPQAGWAPPQPTTRPSDPRRKSPVLATILSVMPGLGQVYVGYYKLGFIHMIVFGTTIAILNTRFHIFLSP